MSSPSTETNVSVIPNLKTVIFDFGGVLLRTHDRSFRHKWDEKLGLELGTFENFIFNGPKGRQAQHGQVTWEAVWESAAKKFNLSEAEITAAKREFFSGDALDVGLVDYIRRLKKHYAIGLLSNTWHRDGLTLLLQYGIANAFHFTLTSAEVGIMKPNPKIYRLALERAKVVPEEALFIDDMQANVLAARNLGIHGIYFVDPALALERLKALTGVA